MQRGNIAILIIILAMLVVGGGAYYLGMSSKSAPVAQPTPQAINAQPTPSVSESTESADMTNWKTYTNNKYSFSFKYPSNWVEKPLPTNASPWEVLLLRSGDATYETTGLGSLNNGVEVGVGILKKGLDKINAI